MFLRPSRAGGWTDRVSNAFGFVLLLVFATFVLGSLAPYRGWSGICLTALGCVSATIALASAGSGHVAVMWAARFSLLAVALGVAAVALSSKRVFGFAALIEMLLFAWAALAVLRAVVLEDTVGFRTILGAVSVYLMLGLLFSFVYVGVERLQGSPFFGTPTHSGDFLFFSITTLTTTGYGNLVPAAQPGRLLAELEMLTGQIFLVTLIARLVSMWQPGQWLRTSPRRAATKSEEALR